MSDDPYHKARWQSVVETLALVLIAIAIASQAVAPRRVAAQPPAANAQVGPRTKPVEPLPADPISFAGAAIQGDGHAKVAIIEYSDFQCPFCGKFERETLPGLRSKYIKSGEVMLAFRNFPLSIHTFAEGAAEASACANEQGKFWQMHDRMFGHQERLDGNSLRDDAKAVGLDIKAFDACLASDAATKVQADSSSGQVLRVSGTPTFFIGVIQADGRVKPLKRLSGAQPLAEFQAAVDQALAAVSAATK